MTDIFESIKNAAPILQKVFPFDCMLGIANREEFVFYLPGDKLKHASPVGKKLAEGDGMWETIHFGKVFNSVIPKEVWGLPFKSIQTPLRDERGTVIGALGFGYSLENQEILQDAVNTIVASTQLIHSSTQLITDNAQILHGKLDELRRSGEAMMKSLKKTNEILSFLKDVATQSSLLGLNAAIEASRAGQFGRGFSVVADEVGKLSVNSSNAVKNAAETLAELKTEILVHEKNIHAADELSTKQTVEMIEISKAMASFSLLVENIRDLAEKV